MVGAAVCAGVGAGAAEEREFVRTTLTGAVTVMGLPLLAAYGAAAQVPTQWSGGGGAA